MPIFIGMTVFIVLYAIVTQSHAPGLSFALMLFRRPATGMKAQSSLRTPKDKA
jgi:hypothetical protein